MNRTRLPVILRCGALLLFLLGGASLHATSVDALIEEQARISALLADVAKAMDAENPAEQRLRTVLHALSVTESAKAVEMLQRYARAQTAADKTAAAADIARNQDRIIEVLEKILGVVAAMKQQTQDPFKQEKGSDLSDLEKEKLRELSEKLKEFLKEQKKTIDATTSLAKTPAADLTPEQEEQLKQLEAVEDKWAQFMKDTRSDLSKLPEQDFSNPALLKELVEIYTELQLAKDSLQAKTLEVAVPAEEAGAELAATMEYNIERWLMDKPDRTRWQMEEPLADYEIPMAELPEQLQDIVGELAEQEEDLMEDIEDATSGWADSADKGIGWDGMDGPISNYSARGITGNALPNSSEISGRSGEGRTGKAAGEFVEQDAVGKGGRKTPTRLTSDAFAKGVVNDKSPEATGGATGGGKISGAGGLGLEGPVPPQLQQQLKALAGRQADLRNKAERVQVRFKSLGYPTDPILRTVRQMETMEQALRAADLHAVTRTRQELVKDIQDTRAFLAGEVRVNRDRSVNLSAEMQDEILNGMDDPTPKAYEDLVKAYFQVLAKPQ